MIRLLSGDTPRSRTLTVLLLLLLLALVCTPFLIPGARALNMAAKICIFVVLVASYDLLLGYTGIVSFAHTMFFGIGGYGVAIAMTRFEPGWGALLAGIVGALAVSMLLALVIGLFSLRVRAIFFAMITLAVATAFATLVSQLSAWTGGEDGLSFKVPALLTPGFALEDADGEVREWLGVPLNGKLFSYYLVLAGAAVLFLLLLRVVNSPFGRVLQAIRENDFRAEAIGYRTVVYRTVSTVLSAAFATLAGVLMAIWLRYNGPDTSLSFEIMVDILLIVVIGGMGTMYGAVIGTVLFLLAQTYLQDVMKLASEATAALPLLSSLLHPDRWLLWLGLLFVLSVYYFPQGIVGRLRALR
ncbi:branched-chain amino acid ABC transporter permease [Cupriavidus cauae]|uniref:Branched-chain amino acid ABC transporter permease n=1 Tax=Cupriavidus cauae TaxID=2608999 RepID=A0A5M8A524_9BURK|nr:MULTISPECIES: branched-chain amino acid ABC transporter permease [Cupriavidus]KAA6117802.1 branched-chain amino acid ABC transporter permease [Cupriavidus cauae]MCA7085897.1 branched-chain amino acid ABC transporter permease [Cupriavidus sp. DB3]UZN48599.1 branched-chain amino acid ABC transporter permease [Cupriavidus cauae]